MNRLRKYLAVGPDEPAGAIVATLIVAILVILAVAAGFRP